MKLRRELNLIDVFSVASGAMISSGLFILPGLAHAIAGPAVFISYFLGGLLAMIGVLSIAELATAMPKAGGDYFFIARAMGPTMGTISGLLSWFALSLKCSLALIGISAFITHILPVDIHIPAIIFCLLFVYLNFIGIKEAGKVQVWLVLGLFLIMVTYIIKGLPHVNVLYYQPFTPKGIGSIFSAAGFIFVSYGGLLKIVSISEEIKSPGKTIPLGMIFSLIIVTIFYTLMVFVTVGVLKKNLLDISLTPISDSAGIFMGPVGEVILTIAAMTAFITTVNAGIMAASRYPLAISRDGFLPESLTKIHPKFKTPYTAIITTGVIIIVSLFLKLDLLIKAASTVLILTYLLSCLCVIIMRESRIQNYRPKFLSPLYPWIQVIGIIGFTFLIFEIGKEALLTTLVLFSIGIFANWLYGNIKTKREFALLHVIERITDKQITSGMLESELMNIIRERDEILKDRFDKLVENAPILDLSGKMDLQTFFKKVAEEMAPRVKMVPSSLYDLLLKREQESSTVLTPHLAIPHIVIGGSHIFELLIARCKGGVEFSKTYHSVQAIFVLIGSKDERNFHLKALSAIAQIVQKVDFEKHWNRAKDEENLRHLILLGERKRLI